jgi:hypothetical protein
MVADFKPRATFGVTREHAAISFDVLATLRATSSTLVGCDGRGDFDVSMCSPTTKAPLISIVASAVEITVRRKLLLKTPL